MKKLFVYALTFLVSGCNFFSKKGEEKELPKQPMSFDFLNYDSVATLSGTLVIEDFWGPPGFGEDTTVDKRESEYVLKTDNSINMLAPVSEGSDSFYVEKSGITKVQLIAAKDLKEYLNKKVEVTGNLMRPHTGHHHTDVLLELGSIKEQ